MRTPLRTPLHNGGIEPAIKTFVVEANVFGARARTVKVEVLANSLSGAAKIFKSFYPRSNKVVASLKA
jgi:hypothetical protein